MSAELIARTVADLVAGRARNALSGQRGEVVFNHARALVRNPTVVDVTDLFVSILESDRHVALYEDHPDIAPPWDEAAICFENTHGNVFVLHANVVPVFGGVTPGTAPWTPAEAVDWTRVRWRIDTFVWVGGRSDTLGTPFPPTGPMVLFQYAVYDDGAPADLHWVQLHSDFAEPFWTNEQLVLLATLNFMACRNVEIVEPERPRGVRRRIARTGVAVHTLDVYPTGRSTRGRTGGRSGGTPLTSVRGHWALYGPRYGRGLLFGKYEGKFWVPQHARGDAEVGESRVDYRLHSGTDPADT